jgi:hypothetical protein
MKITKIMEKRIAVLEALASGRRLKALRESYSYAWEDGNRAPIVAGDVIPWLYRGNMVEDEVKDPCKGAYGDNLTGYVIINSSGDVFLAQCQKGEKS